MDPDVNGLGYAFACLGGLAIVVVGGIGLVLLVSALAPLSSGKNVRRGEFPWAQLLALPVLAIGLLLLWPCCQLLWMWVRLNTR